MASFDAAVDIGIDVVEFDVRAWRGELVLAHTILDARRGANPTLQEALRHLAGPRFRDVELNVDLKHLGCEAAVLEALDHAGLADRTVISCQVAGVLDRVRALDRHARLGSRSGAGSRGSAVAGGIGAPRCWPG